MKLLSIAGLAGLGLLGACQSQGQYVNKHWSERSVGTSMARHFLSYNPAFDGNYRDFAWKKKQAINKTVRRHFFNNNPDNPFQPAPPKGGDPRPVHSLVPHAESYIHYEGLVMGAIMVGAGGAFFPLPIDSIIGSFEPGGGEEFVAGVNEFTRPLGLVTTSFLYDSIGFDRGEGECAGMLQLEGCEGTLALCDETAGKEACCESKDH